MPPSRKQRIFKARSVFLNIKIHNLKPRTYGIQCYLVIVSVTERVMLVGHYKQAYTSPTRSSCHCWLTWPVDVSKFSSSKHCENLGERWPMDFVCRSLIQSLDHKWSQLLPYSFTQHSYLLKRGHCLVEYEDNLKKSVSGRETQSSIFPQEI